MLTNTITPRYPRNKRGTRASRGDRMAVAAGWGADCEMLWPRLNHGGFLGADFLSKSGAKGSYTLESEALLRVFVPSAGTMQLKSAADEHGSARMNYKSPEFFQNPFTVW